MAARNVVRELQQLEKAPLDGIVAALSDEDALDKVTAWIQGPVDTPYLGGFFRVDLSFGATYPRDPPRCRFVTKIFHPNVNVQGDICVNILKKDWSAEFGIAHILTTIRCLLIYPNPESALHEEAGRLLLEDYQDYHRHARLMTTVHATSPPPPTDDAHSQLVSVATPLKSIDVLQASQVRQPTHVSTGSKRMAQAPALDMAGKRRGLKRL